MVETKHHTPITKATAATTWSLTDKGCLLLRLYERALASMEEAISLIHAGDMVAKGERLILAQDIVLQLTDALDGESAGADGQQLAGNLQRLYVYIYRRLIRGNNHLDIEAIREARRLMSTLHTAWRQALTPPDVTSRPSRARL